MEHELRLERVNVALQVISFTKDDFSEETRKAAEKVIKNFLEEENE